MAVKQTGISVFAFFILSLASIATVSAQQGPYYGTPFPLPGTLQAQDFDYGGESVAYHDCDTSNNGGQYRPDEGVDIESGSEGSYDVGWMCEGEWIEYTVRIEDTACYHIESRVASESEGGSFYLEFRTLEDVPVTQTEEITVPVTGNWQNWYTVTSEISIEAGTYILRFVNSGTGEFNIACHRFRTYDPLDYNVDGQFNLDDELMFANCIGGPAVSGGSPSCEIDIYSLKDFDRDGDVDLYDFAMLQRGANGVAFFDPQDWRLVWSDEFDYFGAPDPARWRYEVGYKIRNDEEQYYTAGDNAMVRGGNLIITARKEQYPLPGGGFAEYTSTSMSPTRSWTYGRFEVRAILPTGQGMWPAIWMLGDRIGQVGWPACGEIDIMENVGFDPDTVHASVHTPSYYHVLGTQRTNCWQVSAPYDEFHIYAIEWDEDKIDFFVDRVKYLTFRNEGTGNDAWPFWSSHHLKLNIAVGGSWGAAGGPVDDSVLPQNFLIDYVRVYQKQTTGH